MPIPLPSFSLSSLSLSLYFSLSLSLFPLTSYLCAFLSLLYIRDSTFLFKEVNLYIIDLIQFNISKLGRTFLIYLYHFWVISREIRPLAGYTSSPPIQKVLYTATISSFALDIRSQWSPGAPLSIIPV